MYCLKDHYIRNVELKAPFQNEEAAYLGRIIKAAELVRKGGNM